MLDTTVPVETIAVRNLSKTNVIFSGDTKGGAIEWGYAGSPDGSDLQEIPVHVWNSAWMRKARRNGLLAEDSMEAMDEAITAQRAHAAQQAAARAQEVNAALKAGAAGAPIVISEDAINSHIANVSKSQPSEVLEQAQEAQAQQQAAADAAFAQAEAEATPQAFIPTTNPVAALDGAI